MSAALNASNSSDPIFKLYYYYFPSVVLVMPMGLPANCLVLWALLGKPGICSTSDIFTVSLAAMDVVFCVGLLCEILQKMLLEGEGLLCALAFNQFGGPLHLTFMCLDTYMGVVHPITFVHLKSPRFRICVCVVIWVSTLTFATLYYMQASMATWAIVISQLCLDLVVMHSCLIQVLCALSRAGPGSGRVHPVKRRAFKTVLGLLLMVNVHYCIPVVDFAYTRFHGSSTTYFSPLSLWANTLQSLSSCVQPIFYLARAKNLPWSRGCRRS